jgi:type I restriction enzyme M protein
VYDNNKNAKRKNKVQLIDASSEHFYVPLKKGLGKKQVMLSKENIDEIISIYSKMTENEYSKVLDVDELKYKEFKFFVPRQDSYQFNADKIEMVKTTSEYEDLLAKYQDKLDKALTSLQTNSTFNNRDKFEQHLTKSLNFIDEKPLAKFIKVIIGLCAEHNEDADYVLKGGKKEYDSDLTITESVSIDTEVKTYFEKEVKPFAPKAEIVKGKTETDAIGCEINFNSLFYKEPKVESFAELKKKYLEIKKEIERVDL